MRSKLKSLVVIVLMAIAWSPLSVMAEGPTNWCLYSQCGCNTPSGYHLLYWECACGSESSYQICVLIPDIW